eukprot:352498-Chlamydomonas_euryale.AAC.11
MASWAAADRTDDAFRPRRSAVTVRGATNRRAERQMAEAEGTVGVRCLGALRRGVWPRVWRPPVWPTSPN